MADADLERRMQGAVRKLQEEFAGLRAGRASAAMLDPIKVEAYGQVMPLAQLGTISVPESRLISVQVWDKELVPVVEKALRTSELGLNPQSEGQVIRIPVPPPDEARRRELAKAAGRYAEQARIAVRNIRRDGIDQIRAQEKSGDLSKDEAHSQSGAVDTLAGKIVSEIDGSLKKKEEEILS